MPVIVIVIVIVVVIVTVSVVVIVIGEKEMEARVPIWTIDRCENLPYSYFLIFFLHKCNFYIIFSPQILGTGRWIPCIFIKTPSEMDVAPWITHLTLTFTHLISTN